MFEYLVKKPDFNPEHTNAERSWHLGQKVVIRANQYILNAEKDDYFYGIVKGVASAKMPIIGRLIIVKVVGINELFPEYEYTHMTVFECHMHPLTEI